MARGSRKKFGKFEQKSDFFTFDSEQVRLIKQKRFFSRFKRVFTSYPWWFYYICYILIFTLTIAGLLLYAFYAPASINLSIAERSFVRIPVKQYIYPISLQNLSKNSQQAFWGNYIKSPTDALDPNFITLNEHGPIPSSYDDVPIWQRYRSSYNQPIDRRKKQLVFIIAGLGQNKEVTEFAIDTPPEVTLEFNPYADFLGQWMLFSRSTGHEALIHMPVATSEHRINFDPGPLGFDVSNEEINDDILLNQLMGVTTGYVGIITPYLSQTAIPQNRLRNIFQRFNQQTLISLVHNNYLADARAAGQNLSNSIDWQFHSYTTRDNHQRQLDDLIDIISNSNKRIFIARIHAYNFSIDGIIDWITELNNIQIIPASYLYDAP